MKFIPYLCFEVCWVSSADLWINQHDPLQIDHSILSRTCFLNIMNIIKIGMLIKIMLRCFQWKPIKLVHSWCKIELRCYLLVFTAVKGNFISQSIRYHASLLVQADSNWIMVTFTIVIIKMIISYSVQCKQALSCKCMFQYVWSGL